MTRLPSETKWSSVTYLFIEIGLSFFFFILAPLAALENTLLFGYQGWFSFPSDSPVGWLHWSPGVVPNASDVTFDAWPDLSEFDDEELAPTAFEYFDGTKAKLYSAFKSSTVRRKI